MGICRASVRFLAMNVEVRELIGLYGITTDDFLICERNFVRVVGGALNQRESL